MNHDIILKADNVYFSYDDQKSHSLNGLSLEIGRGKKIAFMGANGSGKSTLVKLICGLYSPCEGQVLHGGIALSTVDPSMLYRGTSAVFQNFSAIR